MSLVRIDGKRSALLIALMAILNVFTWTIFLVVVISERQLVHEGGESPGPLGIGGSEWVLFGGGCLIATILAVVVLARPPMLSADGRRLLVRNEVAPVRGRTWRWDEVDTVRLARLLTARGGGWVLSVERKGSSRIDVVSLSPYRSPPQEIFRLVREMAPAGVAFESEDEAKEAGD